MPVGIKIMIGVALVAVIGGFVLGKVVFGA